MDVRCGRCGTEYEFDDALVSERGTTVKCTNCGYQFRVHAAQATGTPERWMVRTASGRELIYTSLRDLQKGIAQRQVGPDDLLSRGSHPTRALGSIAELEPFFHTRTPPPKNKGTLAGLGGTVAMNGPAGRTPLPNAAEPALPALPPPRAPMSTEPLSLKTLHERRVDALGQTVPLSDAEPPTIPRNLRPTPRIDGEAHASGQHGPLPPPPELPALAPLPPTPPPPALGAPQMTPTPGDVHGGYRREIESLSDARYASSPPPSRLVSSRWIAAIVIVGVLALLAGTVGRKYIARFVVPQGDGTASSDARVAELLDKADGLLANGDLEGAREQLDKASALSDKDAAVLTALARLETIRADLVWLKLRLLDPGDRLLVQSTHRQLGQRVGCAKEAVDKAASVAESDVAVVRARIDVLRLSGDLKQARALVAPIAQNQGTPENAYVLAALDLGEASPGWAAIVERLRTAVTGERDVGRSRVALVYALARADRVTEAETEIGKLEAKSAAHPLLPELKAFLERFSAAAADGGIDAATEVATVDPAALPVLDTTPSEGPEPPAGDFRNNLKQAAAAIKRGDLDRAEQLYNAVLAKDPDNTEALAGLGDVARQRRDPEKAAQMYDKVLKSNPSYLPALMARADQKWDSGDKQGAAVLYRRIIEQAGAGTPYGQRAASRIAASEGAPGDKPTPKEPAEAPSAEPAEPPSEPAPKEDQPHIDTTDLPELNK